MKLPRSTVAMHESQFSSMKKLINMEAPKDDHEHAIVLSVRNQNHI
jgi:hypothetical protein